MEDNLKSQWAELADTLSQAGLDTLAGAPLTVTEKRFADPNVLAIMLMSRTLSNFKGVLTLMENGFVVEARILVRGALLFRECVPDSRAARPRR
jgi:hypothetical protein